MNSTAPAGEAAAAILERHRDELERFLSALVGAQAPDVMQEAWLRLSRVLAGERPVQHPRALLFRIAANLARDELRRRKRQATPVPDTEPYQEGSAPSASDQLQLDQDLERLRRAVDALPERCRRAFLLKRVDGLSYREIARREGITEKTVENQVGRALKLIRARMEEE